MLYRKKDGSLSEGPNKYLTGGGRGNETDWNAYPFFRRTQFIPKFKQTLAVGREGSAEFTALLPSPGARLPHIPRSQPIWPTLLPQRLARRRERPRRGHANFRVRRCRLSAEEIEPDLLAHFDWALRVDGPVLVANRGPKLRLRSQ